MVIRKFYHYVTTVIFVFFLSTGVLSAFGFLSSNTQYYRADLPKNTLYSDHYRIQYHARFISDGYNKLINDSSIPMNYQFDFKVKGTKVNKVFIDSILICNRDSIVVQAIRNVELLPVKPNSNKFILSNSLSNQDLKPIKLYYHSGSLLIAGTRFYSDTTISFGTNWGYKQVLWSENQYLFRLYGRYETIENEFIHFTDTESLYLYFR